MVAHRQHSQKLAEMIGVYLVVTIQRKFQLYEIGETVLKIGMQNYCIYTRNFSRIIKIHYGR